MKMKMKEFKEKLRKFKLTKAHATFCISIILLQTVGMLYLGGVIMPAVASTSMYDVENVIYVNVTTPGGFSTKSEQNQTFKTIRITNQGSSNGFQVLLNKPAFSYDKAVNQYGRITEMDNELETTGVQFVGDQRFDFSHAEKAFSSSYANGTTLLANATDFYTNFGHSDSSYPSIERHLYFDSPNYIAAEYCDLHGYAFVNVVNSTYEESVNTESLNTLRSRLIKTDQIIVDLSAYEYESESALNTSAGDFEVESIIGTLAIIVVVAVIIVVVAPAILQEVGRIITGVAEIQAERDVAIAAVNAERDIQVELTRELGTTQRHICDLVANDSISFEEGQALLELAGAPYTEQLENRSTNIQEILDEYYENSGASSYGAVFSTSWTSLFSMLFLGLFIVAIFVIVYLFVRRSKFMRESTNLCLGKCGGC